MVKVLRTPITDGDVDDLHIRDMIQLSGKIYCGRDAVLPKICDLIKCGKLDEYGIDLKGSVIFHTAVSPAGVGPTSSNKLEIEDSIPTLSRAGVKIHLGKGAIKKETVAALNQHHSVFAVVPPVTALLGKNMVSKKCVAFPELGMEALYQIEVREYPMVVAAAHNESIY